MQTYRTFRPTGCDQAGLNLPDRQDWLVAPCGTNRDADRLTRSNWECLLELLEKQYGPGGDGEDPECQWERHSFGHWACGHFDIVLLRPGSPAADECERIESALAYYPVLDDSHFSELEFNDACETWAAMSYRERSALLAHYGLDRKQARRKALPSDLPEFSRLLGEY